ncbi:MAG: TetR/AcrR family transcriptional regulator [Gemmatimonadales bacterium]|nr:TetR/AcrR family transcriptional regulator [Gemmatimonadales bacterium]
MSKAAVVPKERGGREAILSAAIAVLDSCGPDRFTARAVAARAGVSATAIYRHFTDLQALYDAVLADGRRRFAGYLADGADLPDALDRLHAAGDGYLRFAIEHPVMYHALFLGPARMPGGRDGGYPILRERVADCQSIGALPGDDPDMIALTLWSSVHGLTALHLSGHLGASDRGYLEQGRMLVRLVTRLRGETSTRRPS